MTTAVLFDLDGTLLDTLGDLTDAVNYTLRHYGSPQHTERSLRYIIGNGTAHLLASAFGEHGKGLDMDAVLQFYRRYYDAHSIVRTCPYPGVCQAVAQLQNRYPVAIVSNKPHAVVMALRDRFFPGVYALGECADRPRKPAPDMVQKAMADLGADRCIYVGDTEIDVDTARNADVPCLTVLWGFRDKNQLEAAGARHFCENTADLAAAIEALIEK